MSPEGPAKRCARTTSSGEIKYCLQQGGLIRLIAIIPCPFTYVTWNSRRHWIPSTLGRSQATSRVRDSTSPVRSWNRRRRSERERPDSTSSRESIGVRRHDLERSFPSFLLAHGTVHRVWNTLLPVTDCPSLVRGSAR